MSQPPDFVLFIGRFHPVLVHLPIGFLVLLVLLEMLSLLPRLKPVAGAVRPILALFIPAAAASVICGLLLARGGGYDPVLVRWHQFTGIGVAVAGGVLYVLHRRGPALAYRALLAVSFLLLMVAGHLGGSLTHGSGYLTRHAPVWLRAWLGAKPASGFQVGTAASLTNRTVFADVIQPVLNANCVACHGPEKSKADLRLDSYQALLAGGENGPVIAPDNPGSSLLLEVLNLPIEDRLHMPPEGKPQPSPDDLALLEWWIESGAPESRSVDELHPAPRIARILDSRLGRRESSAPAGVPPRPFAEVAPLLGRLEAELGVAFGRLGESDSWLQCNASIAGTNFTDDGLASLAPVAANLHRLDLGGTAISDAGLAQVAAMPNLHRLHLERSGISDAGLVHLAGLRQLEYLNLHGTGISDAGLADLKRLPALRKVFLWQSRVTPEAARELAEALTDQDQIQRLEREVVALKADIEKHRVTVDLGAASGEADAGSPPINAVCPVSGRPADPLHSILHEGRRVAFCCLDCRARFTADPKAFMNKLEVSDQSTDTKR